MLSCRACHSSSGDDMQYCGTCGEPLRDDVPNRKPRESKVLPSGTVVGSYKLLEVLGEGGMGRVYLAEHSRLGRKVAIKMLRSKFSSSPESIRRFFGEARAVNKIAHENIVEVTDFVSEEDGNSYYIMELLKGKSLYDQIKVPGSIPLDRTLAIAVQVANALGAVHEAGIVHRDLKPENIFLAQKGSRKDVVKLLDFGIAKLMEPDQGVSLQQTGVGMILGTPTYMSPEQAGGRAIDSRSDIYSLGIILYELTTGQVPFTADTYAEILVQHITQEPRRPNTIDTIPQSVPPPLEQLILRCLRKDPGDRPQTMSEVEEVLRDVLTDIQRVPNRTVVGTGPVPQQVRPSFVTPGAREAVRPPTAPVVSTTGPITGPSIVTEIRLPAPRGQRRRLGLILVLVVAALLVGGAIVGVVLVNEGRGDDDKSQPVPVADKDNSGELPDPPAAAAAATPVSDDGKVALRVDSSPAGAEVFREGEAEPLGVTPLTTRLPKTSEPVRFELRKEGFATVQQEARLDHDAYLSVGLASLPAAKPTATASKPVSKTPRKRPPRKDRRKSDHTIEKGGVIDFE